MTENEAIWVLKDFDKQVTVKADGAYQSTIGEMACKVAVTALEEIQQYRALGTVKELQEAMEKQREKKPKFYAHNFYCHKCGNLVGNNEFGWKRFMYCDRCGQAIDWSE